MQENRRKQVRCKRGGLVSNNILILVIYLSKCGIIYSLLNVNDWHIMKKYGFAWFCLGFTMIMPLFISHYVGAYLTIGAIVTVFIFIMSATWDKIPQEVKDQMDEATRRAQNNRNDELDVLDDPSYRNVPGNIYNHNH